MIGRRTATVAVMAMTVGLAGAAQAGAQDPPTRVLQEQQMMRLQAQTMQLNEAIRHMERIRERAQVLEQHLVQEMARLRENPREGAQNSAMLQNQERLRTMVQAVGDGAREVHRAMEQLRLMIGEPGPGWDQETERELARLRVSWEETAQRMEEGLAIMERLRDRLGQPEPSR